MCITLNTFNPINLVPEEVYLGLYKRVGHLFHKYCCEHLLESYISRLDKFKTQKMETN